MPFFSVVIPTYNRAKLIGIAIDSVLKQTFSDFELIIVDDGSTDETKAVIQAISDSRIRYFYQPNGERGKARNTGTKSATGDYVFFLDSDDFIYPEHLKHAYEEIKKLDDPEFFHVRYSEQYPDGRFVVKELSKEHLQKDVLRQNKFACQFFLKRSIALDFPFSENRDLKIGEDWEVVLKIAVRYPLHFSNKPLGVIVHHNARSMELASADTILKSRKILIENLGKDPEIGKAIQYHVHRELTSLAALSAAINGEKARSFKLWHRSKINVFKRRSLAIFKKLIFGGKA